MNGLPSWWGSSLACGCVRGVRLCAEGERLWNAVADAHNEIAKAFRNAPELPHSGVGLAYRAALQDFNAHVEVVAEAAEQRPML